MALPPNQDHLLHGKNSVVTAAEERPAPQYSLVPPPVVSLPPQPATPRPARPRNILFLGLDASTSAAPLNPSHEEFINDLLEQQAIVTAGLQGEIQGLLDTIKRQESEIAEYDAAQEAHLIIRQREIVTQEKSLLDVTELLLAVTREKESIMAARWNTILTANER